ncbi:MAG: hypothetical protein J3K34DRAFT_12109 [Monoraphidium minutum]|nr:MAG: hypothetical protein J3K34DRAFT_12109 [Monoraphidium minutum]
MRSRTTQRLLTCRPSPRRLRRAARGGRGWRRRCCASRGGWPTAWSRAPTAPARRWRSTGLWTWHGSMIGRTTPMPGRSCSGLPQAEMDDGWGMVEDAAVQDTDVLMLYDEDVAPKLLAGGGLAAMMNIVNLHPSECEQPPGAWAPRAPRPRPRRCAPLAAPEASQLGARLSYTGLSRSSPTR